MMDRVEELAKLALLGRLGKGSAYLGEVRSKGLRCGGGWTSECPCGTAATALCRGKLRWIKYLLELHDGQWPYELTGKEPFAIIEAMTVSQFMATGLTALVELPGAEKPIRVGKRGTIWETIVHLALTVPGEDREQALKSVQDIQTVLA